MPATNHVKAVTVIRNVAAALIIALAVACNWGKSGDDTMPADSGQLEPFCNVMRDLDQKSLAPFSGLSEDSPEEQFDKAMTEMAQMYIARAAELEKTAPAAARADIKVILDAYRAFVGGNVDALQDQAYLAATDRLDDWLEQNCGMVLTEPEEEDGG